MQVGAADVGVARYRAQVVFAFGEVEGDYVGRGLEFVGPGELPGAEGRREGSFLFEDEGAGSGFDAGQLVGLLQLRCNGRFDGRGA